jgi:uncharacterized membrane protein
MKTELWAIGLVLLASTLGSFGPILLKKASKKIRLNLKCLTRNYHLLGGLCSYAVGTILFIPALKGGELSVLYPFVALGYVWVSLLSIRFLKEKMNSLKWLGVVSIILGIIIIGLGA